MADVTNTMLWVPYAPDLLGNRALERPFYFELAASLSKEQLNALEAGLTTPPADAPPLAVDPTPEQSAAHDVAVRRLVAEHYGKLLEPYVRMGAEPLVVEGERIEGLTRYLDFTLEKLAGVRAFFEPWQALRSANTLGAASSFFSGRLSGGFTSMTRGSVGKASGQTAAR